jgi:shikimate dehydrogenase
LDIGHGSFYNRPVSEMFAIPISATTRYCAVLGHPIKHSASPPMQNAGIAALRLNWRYLAFDVHPDHLRDALAGAKAMGFIGLNLTVPHKLLALEMVDALDESARTWGAVNTIRFEAQDDIGQWRPLGELMNAVPERVRSHGFNTDADAIARSLRDDLGLKIADAKVLLLGAGGAGRTAALKLASEGAVELFLVNRTESKANAVAKEIRQRWPQVKVVLGYPPSAVDLVLNATSLGLSTSDPLPFEARSFSLRQAGAAYDMIYRPPETPFLREAKAAGCRVANGLGMLLYQGVKALELWSGREAPIEGMREALVANVYGK